jgi:hypothetical protein
VSSVYYLGSLGGFQASSYMWLHPSDPAKDVFINAVAATVLPERSNWPAAAQNLTAGQCLQETAAKPAVGVVGSSSGNAISTDATRASNGSSAAVGGRHRKLMTLPVFKLTTGGAAGEASAGMGGVDVTPMHVLCELSSMLPSAIKTLPDLLARKAFNSLTGHDWFNMP